MMFAPPLRGGRYPGRDVTDQDRATFRCTRWSTRRMPRRHPMNMAAACPNPNDRPEILGVLDLSNIFITAKDLCQDREGPLARSALRLHLSHLATLIRDGRPGT